MPTHIYHIVKKFWGWSLFLIIIIFLHLLIHQSFLYDCLFFWSFFVVACFPVAVVAFYHLHFYLKKSSALVHSAHWFFWKWFVIVFLNYFFGSFCLNTEHQFVNNIWAISKFRGSACVYSYIYNNKFNDNFI